MQQRIPEWVNAIDEHLPFAGDGAQRFAARAASDGRLRRRLRSIVEREHISSVTVERVRAHIRQVGLPEERFLAADDTLVYEDAFEIVYLLNEDFFQGGLTDAGFRSDRKSPR